MRELRRGPPAHRAALALVLLALLARVDLVDAHPEAGYAAVVKLMDAVRDAGNQANIKVKIGLASLKEEEDFVACTPPAPKAEALVAPATEGAL